MSKCPGEISRRLMASKMKAEKQSRVFHRPVRHWFVPSSHLTKPGTKTSVKSCSLASLGSLLVGLVGAGPMTLDLPLVEEGRWQ